MTTNEAFNKSMKDKFDQLQAELQRKRSPLAPSTLHGATTLSDETGGRYQSVNKRVVVGSGEVPSYPAAPNWPSQQVPPEPPLGYDINAMEVNEGFAGEHERKAKEQEQK
jgi:hypothetical protein